MVISDLEQVKGYEFDTVIIVNCEAGILPLTGIHEGEIYRSACQLYVAMTRAKNDLFLSYHDTPSDWLANTQYIYCTEWSTFEEIRGLRLMPIPYRLTEIHDPENQQDMFVGMTGLEFTYTKHSMGLSIENQNKVIELADGRSVYSSNKRMNTQWKDIRNLINDLEHDPNVRARIGPALTDRLRGLDTF